MKLTKSVNIGPSNDASLFSIVWTLCNAITLLITGRVSDKFGRRNFVLVAGGLAVIGGIVASTAKTMETLIGANVCDNLHTLGIKPKKPSLGDHWPSLWCSLLSVTIHRRQVFTKPS